MLLNKNNYISSVFYKFGGYIDNAFKLEKHTFLSVTKFYSLEPYPAGTLVPQNLCQWLVFLSSQETLKYEGRASSIRSKEQVQATVRKDKGLGLKEH